VSGSQSPQLSTVEDPFSTLYLQNANEFLFMSEPDSNRFSFSPPAAAVAASDESRDNLALSQQLPDFPENRLPPIPDLLSEDNEIVLDDLLDLK
jgi:hypothetical protein